MVAHPNEVRMMFLRCIETLCCGGAIPDDGDEVKVVRIPNQNRLREYKPGLPMLAEAEDKPREVSSYVASKSVESTALPGQIPPSRNRP